MQYMDKDACNYLSLKWVTEKNLTRLVFRIIHLRSKRATEQQHGITMPATREYIDKWVKRMSQVAPTVLVMETWTESDEQEVKGRNKKAIAKLRAYAKELGFTVHKTNVGFTVDPVGDCIKELIKIGWISETKKEVTLNYRSHKYTAQVCEYVSNK